MKKYYLLLSILTIFFLATQVKAATQPRLFVNDSLKECQMYSFGGNEYLVNGWRDAEFRYPKLDPPPLDGINQSEQVQAEKTYNTEEEYCSSLGYTMQQDRQISEVKGTKYISATKIIFWIIFVCLISLLYFHFVRVKKRYFIFTVYLLLTAFILGVVAYPFVVYQINPCYPTFVLMGCF